jgi:hypothetical protein
MNAYLKIRKMPPNILKKEKSKKNVDEPFLNYFGAL